MSRGSRFTFLLALGVILTLLMGACSNNNEPAASSAASPEASASESPAASPSETASASPEASAPAAELAFPRTVASFGGDITIEKKPERIALVHWGLSDALLTFDLSTVAFALPFTEQSSATLHSDVYKPYVDKVGDITIVGENTAVNLEALLAYEPDLILAGSVTNEAILADLQKIATTYVIDEATTDVWNNWQDVVTQFGAVIGQEDVAQKYIDDFAAKVAAAKEKLAGVEGNVAFIQTRDKTIYLQGTNYAKLYYEGLGLMPPEQSVGDGAELSMEGLSNLNPDHLFIGYFNYSAPSIPALADEWEKTEVWKKLAAAQNNQVYKFNGELGYGFGPIAKSYGLDEVVKALE